MSTNIFAGDLRIPMAESIGPCTNSRSVNLLHPDMCQSNTDIGRARIEQRQVDRSAYLPDVLRNNIIITSPVKVDANGDLAAKSVFKPDGQTIESTVAHIETDAVKTAYLDAQYAQDATIDVTTDGTIVVEDLPEAKPEKPLLHLFVEGLVVEVEQ